MAEVRETGTRSELNINYAMYFLEKDFVAYALGIFKIVCIQLIFMHFFDLFP